MVNVEPKFDPETGTAEILVEIGALPSGALGRGMECYFNLYVTDLERAGCAWVPRSPVTWPAVTTCPTPFAVAVHDVPFCADYLGILVSVCTAEHAELEWCCSVFRTADGNEVKDCRRPFRSVG